MRSTKNVEKFINRIRKESLDVAKEIRDHKIDAKTGNSIANQLRISAQMTTLEFRVIKMK